MKLQELKEKIEFELSEVMYKGSDLHNEFTSLFSEFEKSQEEENKGNKVFLDRFESNEKEIDNLKSTIKSMAEAVKIYIQLTDPKIAELESMKAEIETLKKTVSSIRYLMNKDDKQEMPTPEKKEERFYYVYPGEGRPSEVYDNSRVNKWMCQVAYSSDASDICKALNAQEAGK